MYVCLYLKRPSFSEVQFGKFSLKKRPQCKLTRSSFPWSLIASEIAATSKLDFFVEVGGSEFFGIGSGSSFILRDLAFKIKNRA
jgi:hypothetical protein